MRPGLVAAALAAGGIVVGTSGAAALGERDRDDLPPAPPTAPGAATTSAPAAPRRLPVEGAATYAPDEHHDYPAADLFTAAGCGTPIVAPSAGVVAGFEAATTYDPAIDDPAGRGGNWVAIDGPDGVRYYLAHLETVDPGLVTGSTVVAGDPVGTIGATGRAGACHVHVGLSPAVCPLDAWWVRRGVVWPSQYLDAWRDGEDRSPGPEVGDWLSAHPGACEDQAATGFPVG